MDYPLPTFTHLPYPTAALYLLLINLALFLLSLTTGHLLRHLFRSRQITPPAHPTTRKELLLAATCILLNTVVSFAGLLLWRNNILHIRTDLSLRTLLDFVILFLAMDLLMYLFHRAAHHPFLFNLFHFAHHEYANPKPIDLFVLHPIEVLGFGALWLILLTLYPASWAAITAYLALNLLFGTLGHLGVEPYPSSWKSHRFLQHLGSSTFHADHHQRPHVNFGFYTTIWDRLFRTQNTPSLNHTAPVAQNAP